MTITFGYLNSTTNYYLISDNPDKPFTGLLYTADGQQVFDFEVGLIGGGPDCNTPHIREDAFTYEENGKLGLITVEGNKVTPAVYDAIRDDYHGSAMISIKAA